MTYYESRQPQRHAGARLERRRHRPAPGGAVVHPRRDRPDDDGAGCRVLRGPARAGEYPEPQVRRFHRDQPVCGLPDRFGTERARPALQHGLHDLRLGRALSRHLLQRPLAAREGLRHRALPAATGRLSRHRALAADAGGKRRAARDGAGAPRIAATRRRASVHVRVSHDPRPASAVPAIEIQDQHRRQT